MNLLQLAEITSYHGLVEDVNIKCEDKEMCTLLTKLVQGLKGEEKVSTRFKNTDLTVLFFACN